MRATRPDAGPAEMLIRCLADRGRRTKDQGPATAVWTDVVDLAVGEHVAPLLFKRLKESDAQALIPADAWRRLHRAYFNSSDRNTRLFRELTTVLSGLRGAGIPVIVLKGAYLAEAVYGDVALRPMCDNDLLIPPENLARAEAVLLDMGGVQQQPSRNRNRNLPPRHKDTKMAAAPARVTSDQFVVGSVPTSALWPPVSGQPADIESECEMWKHALPVLIRDLAIELHWTIVSPTGPVRVDAAGLWNRAHPALIAGVEVLSLSPEDLLLHLCLHFSYQDDCVGLRSLCDVAETIRHFGGEVDPEVRHGTTEHLENWRMEDGGWRMEDGGRRLGSWFLTPRSSFLNPHSSSAFSVASVVEPVSVPGIDWQEVAERAREWGATRHVGLALHLAGSMLGAAVPAEVLERLVPEGIDQRVLEAAREAVLTQTARHHWESLFSAQGTRSPGEKAKFLRERVFLSREEMAEKYPASRGSKHFYLYYALRLRDGIRAYTFHALRRARLMLQRRRRERYNALYEWLKRQ